MKKKINGLLTLNADKLEKAWEYENIKIFSKVRKCCTRTEIAIPGVSIKLWNSLERIGANQAVEGLLNLD